MASIVRRIDAALVDHPDPWGRRTLLINGDNKLVTTESEGFRATQSTTAGGTVNVPYGHVQQQVELYAREASPVATAGIGFLRELPSETFAESISRDLVQESKDNLLIKDDRLTMTIDKATGCILSLEHEIGAVESCSRYFRPVKYRDGIVLPTAGYTARLKAGLVTHFDSFVIDSVSINEAVTDEEFVIPVNESAVVVDARPEALQENGKPRVFRPAGYVSNALEVQEPQKKTDDPTELTSPSDSSTARTAAIIVNVLIVMILVFYLIRRRS